MPDVVELAPFALLALLGAGHCAGMCGGFALGVCLRAKRRRAAVWHLSLYGLGKASTYATLAVLVATVSSRATSSAEHFGGVHGDGVDVVRRVVALAAGAVLVGMGLSQAGLMRSRREWRVGSALERWVAGLALVRDLPDAAGALGIGVVSGFLPCGLTWAALALAAQSTPAAAALGTFVFGLSTLPALWGVGLGGRFVPPALRLRLARLSGPLLIVFGVLTAARGFASAPDAPCPTCALAAQDHEPLHPASSPRRSVREDPVG